MIQLTRQGNRPTNMIEIDIDIDIDIPIPESDLLQNITIRRNKIKIYILQQTSPLAINRNKTEP